MAYAKYDVTIEEFWVLRLKQEQHGIDFGVFKLV